MASINIPTEVEYNVIEVEIGGKVAHAKVEEFKGSDVLSIRFTWEPSPGKVAYTRHGVNIPLYEGLVAIDALVTSINQATGSDLMVVNERDLRSLADEMGVA